MKKLFFLAALLPALIGLWSFSVKENEAGNPTFNNEDSYGAIRFVIIRQNDQFFPKQVWANFSILNKQTGEKITLKDVPMKLKKGRYASKLVYLKYGSYQIEEVNFVPVAGTAFSVTEKPIQPRLVLPHLFTVAD